jgi:hypothetical protein
MDVRVDEANPGEIWSAHPQFDPTLHCVGL